MIDAWKQLLIIIISLNAFYRMYNKEAVLQLLLNRDSVSEGQAPLVKHIRNLKV